MSLKTRIGLVVSLVFLFTAVTAGQEAKPIKPLPTEAFRRIELPEASVLIIPTYPPTPTPSPVPTKAPPRATPKPSPKVVTKVKLKVPKLSGRMRSGVASYYCNKDSSRGKLSRCRVGYPDGKNSYYAAIRKDLLFLRGRRIQVCEGRNCLWVKVIDCNCGRNANLIDLYGDAFAYFHPLTKGTFGVTIRW